MVPWWTLLIVLVVAPFLTLLVLGLCQTSASNDPSKRTERDGPRTW